MGWAIVPNKHFDRGQNDIWLKKYVYESDSFYYDNICAEFLLYIDWIDW